MPSRNFYTGKMADIAAGSANFAQLITSGAVGFGLTAGQATIFSGLNTTLQSAQEAMVEPATRSPVAVQNRRAALAAMRGNAKLLARIIYATPTVTDGQLVSLGLLPRNPPSPRPFPLVAPQLLMISMVGRQAKLRVKDAENPDRRGLAEGTIGVNIFSFVGPVAPTDTRSYFFEGMSSRALATVQFPDSVASGSTVWLSAQWVGSRGRKSFACPPINFTLQGGNVLPQAA